MSTTSKKLVRAAGESISFTLEVLVSLASVFEPLLLGYHDMEAYERHKAYEHYRRWHKAQRAEKEQYIRPKTMIDRKEYVKYDRAVKELEKSTCIIENKKNHRVTITEKGWLRLLKIVGGQTGQSQSSITQKSKRSYMIVFDVPERFRKVRDQLRRCLYASGFAQVQKSIFMTYDGKVYRLMGKIIKRSEIGVYAKGIVGTMEDL